MTKKLFGHIRDALGSWIVYLGVLVMTDDGKQQFADALVSEGIKQ